MIQRLQTVYLFLVVLFSAIILMGKSIAYIMMPFAILMTLIMILSVIGIFMYKNRKRQRTIVISALIINIAALALVAYYYISSKQTGDTSAFNYRYLAPVLNLFFLILASRGIKKDDDLVKSYDRLR